MLATALTYGPLPANTPDGIAAALVVWPATGTAYLALDLGDPAGTGRVLDAAAERLDRLGTPAEAEDLWTDRSDGGRQLLLRPVVMPDLDADPA
jgi:hypothetical protein